jgi:hypothetical protein
MLTIVEAVSNFVMGQANLRNNEQHRENSMTPSTVCLLEPVLVPNTHTNCCIIDTDIEKD